MPEKEHRHKHKSGGGDAKKSSKPRPGVYTGRTEEVPLLDGGAGSDSGGFLCFKGPNKRKNIIFAAVFVFVVVVVAVCAVFLSLPATYTCDAREGSYYAAVVPPPTLERADPPVVCAAHTTALTLHGTTFIAHADGTQPTVTVALSDPAVRAADVRLGAVNATACRALHVRRRAYRACAALGLAATFPRHPAAASYAATVAVENPAGPRPAFGRVANATCRRVAARVVTVIPSPAVSGVAPGFLCRGGANALALAGSYFVQARPTGSSADRVPSFALCGAPAASVADVSACTDLPHAAGYDYIRSCAALVAETDAAACTPGALAALELANPEPGACPAVYPDELRLPVTEPPAVAASVPAVCAADGSATLALHGSGFVSLDGAAPTVLLDGTSATSVTADECTLYTVGENKVEFCKSLTIGVPAPENNKDDETRSVELTISASDGTSCPATITDTVFYVPPPTVDSVEPAVLCHADVAQNVSLRGRFVQEKDGAGAGFTVEIGAEGTPAGATYLADCTERTVGGRAFVDCATLAFEVAPETPYGPLALTVRGGACARTVAAEQFQHVPAPNVTGLSQRTLCRAALNVVTLTGTGFVAAQQRTLLPRVVLDDGAGARVAATDVAVDGCTPVPQDPAFELCTQLTFTINGAAFGKDSDSATLTVSNMDTETEENRGGCGSTEVIAKMPIVGVPTVTDYERDICEGADATVRVTGADFRAGAVEFLLRGEDGTLHAANVTDVGATGFTAAFAAGALAAGTYGAVVRSAPQAECTATGTTTPVAVHANGLALVALAPALVPPPAGRAPASVTIAVRGLDALPAALELRSDARALLYTAANITAVDGDPARLALRLPADLAAGETFNATLVAQTTCRADAPRVLAVAAAQPTGTLTVSPRAISALEDSTVTVTVAEGSASSAFTAEDVFAVLAIPTSTTVSHEMHNNNNGGKNDNNETEVYALEDIRVVSTTQVSARVVAGALPAGTYTVHVTRAATREHWARDVDLAVLAVARPQIAAVEPTLLRPAGETLRVRGANFGARTTTHAELRCRGASAPVALAVSVLSAEELELTLGSTAAGTDALDDHTSCALVVSGDSGALPAVYRGLAVARDRTRPNWHLAKFAHGVCGAAAVAARAGERAFVYVLGGDRDAECTGNAPSATAHVAEVDAGAAGAGLPAAVRAWTPTSALPTALAFAPALAVGTCVYVLGGHSAAGALRTVHRAQVLQPEDAPSLRAALRAAPTGRLAPGHYLYAVTARYGADDKLNPGGESLPSNVAAVHVPTATGVPHLSWTAPNDPGITAYRVYRAAAPEPASLSLSKGADATPDGETPEPAFALLAEVSKPEYDDLGSDEPDATQQPPRVGALGRWAVLEAQPMPTARCAHAAASSSATAGAQTHHFLFALGGTDGAPTAAGAALNSYDSTDVTVKPGAAGGAREQHEVSVWRAGTARVRGRRFAGAVTLDRRNGAGLEGVQAFVLGPGASADASGAATVDGTHQVNYAENSEIFAAAAFAETALPDFAHFGYCLFAHNDTLVAVAGSADAATRAPAANNAHAMALSTASAARPPTPLTKYEHLADGPLLPTVYPACVRAGGSLILVGGRDEEGNLLDSIQYVAG